MRLPFVFRPLQISIDNVEKEKFDVENRFDHPLFADTLVLGSSENLPADAFSTNDYFKGTLQDVRINDRVVPLTTLPSDIEAQQFGTRIVDENILQVEKQAYFMKWSVDLALANLSSIKSELHEMAHFHFWHRNWILFLKFSGSFLKLHMLQSYS